MILLHMYIWKCILHMQIFNIPNHYIHFWQTNKWCIKLWTSTYIYPKIYAATHKPHLLRLKNSRQRRQEHANLPMAHMKILPKLLVNSDGVRKKLLYMIRLSSSYLVIQGWPLVARVLLLNLQLEHHPLHWLMNFLPHTKELVCLNF